MRASERPSTAKQTPRDDCIHFLHAQTIGGAARTPPPSPRGGTCGLPRVTNTHTSFSHTDPEHSTQCAETWRSGRGSC